jgi:nitrate/nitrite transporter NarK
LKKPFYGWIIVGVAFLIGITESAAFQAILAIFMKPMASEFGWSRAAIAGSIAIGSLSAALLSPFIGPVLDRHGTRMTAFWSILFLSLGLVGMTFVSRIWQLYLIFGMGRMIAVGILLQFLFYFFYATGPKAWVCCLTAMPIFLEKLTLVNRLII